MPPALMHFVHNYTHFRHLLNAHFVLMLWHRLVALCMNFITYLLTFLHGGNISHTYNS